MPFVQAKCPECGGMLAVDDSKKAAVCQFCGEAFIVQEAIINNNTYVTNDNRTTHNYGEGTVVNVYENQNSVSTLLRRVFMFLEDGDWDSADEYCEKVLDIEPENAQAYLGKFMSEMQVRRLEELKDCVVLFENNTSYQKVIRFCDDDLKNELEAYADRARNNRISLKNELGFISDDELYELECPMCGEIIYLDEELLEYKIIECPACGEKLEVNVVKSEKILRKNAEEERREKNKTLLKPQIERALKLQRRFDISRYIMSDGTVYGENKNPNLYDIIAFSGNIFLKENGTVVVPYLLPDYFKEWTNIIDVAAGNSHYVGLKSDGTVVAVGDNKCGQCDVSDWTDIVAICVGKYHTVGLKSDGTVVATGEYLNEEHCFVSTWTDIVAISASGYHTVGLKSDGTVVADGDRSCYEAFGSPSVYTWSNIIAIAAGDLFTVGVTSAGNVFTIGNDLLRVVKEAKKWKDIVAISTKQDRIVGLKSDGTLITYPNEYTIGKLCNDINNFDEEFRLAKIERNRSENRSKGLCQHCGGSLKGLFSKTCTKCGKPKDY